MQEVYALPFNAHTECYIYTFTVKMYAFPKPLVMFRKILSGIKKKNTIAYIIPQLCLIFLLLQAKLCMHKPLHYPQAGIERDPQNCLHNNFWVIRKSCRWVSRVKYFTHFLELEQSHEV